MKKRRLLFSSNGQATIEYVVVVTALIAVLMGTNSIFSEFRKVFIDKYKSYCFGISISDPPSPAFIGEEKKVKELEEYIENLDVPVEDLPFLSEDEKEVIELFEKIVHKL